jgi:hypothetical protein
MANVSAGGIGIAQGASANQPYRRYTTAELHQMAVERGGLPAKKDADEDGDTLADDATTATGDDATTLGGDNDGEWLTPPGSLDKGKQFSAGDSTLLPPSDSSPEIQGNPSSSESGAGFGSRLKKLFASPAVERRAKIMAKRPPIDPNETKEEKRLREQREWYGKGLHGLPKMPKPGEAFPIT